MARRKKKAKSVSAQGTGRHEPVLAVKKNNTQEKKADQSSQDTAHHSGRQTGGISIATCLAGMFLTLVLGIYLGTLLPDLVRQPTVGPITEAGMRNPDPPAPAFAPLDRELQTLVADLEKKAAANPDSAPDWINLGNIYFDSQQPEKAISAYERALSLAPKNADVLTDLGIMYRENGQFDKAIECFRRAVAINPGHENAMYNEGVVLLNDLHKKSDAAAAWQRLLDINPLARSPQGKPLKDLIGELR